MGSTDSISQNNTLRLNLDNWEYVPESTSQRYSIRQMCARLKNKMTGEELDQYDLYIRNNDQRNQYEDMVFFRNQNEILVPIVHINQENFKKLCSVSYYLKVYIEPYPLRMSNIKDVQFPENLYLLARVLKGFKILYDKVGRFHITEDLVCINEEGIVKVWMNHNLASHQPQSSNEQIDFRSIRSRIKQQEQNSMVWEIITMIEKNTNKQSIPGSTNFIEFLKNNRIYELNFTKTNELLYQYASKINIQVPQIFQSIVKIIRQQKGIFDSEMDINQNIMLSKSQQLQSAIRNRRFKQSQVQRVEGFRQQSIRSYVVSESNNTFADRLKKYDNELNKTKIYGFGENSATNRTPTKDSFIYSLPAKKQINTQRQLPIFMSTSQISSQPPGSQSLTVLGNLASHPEVIQINSNNNSQILSIRQSQSNRRKETNTPQKAPKSYFSQYLQEVQEEEFTTKQRQLSFGPRDSNLPNRASIGMVKNTPLVSLKENSAKDLQNFGYNTKPRVTFTYLNSFNPSLHQSSVSNKDNEQNKNLYCSPISPPSIENPKQNIKMVSHSIQKQKRELDQVKFSEKQVEQSENAGPNQQLSTQPFSKVRGNQQQDEQIRKEIAKKNLASKIQQIAEVVQKLEESKSNLNEQSKQYNQKIDFGVSVRRRVASEQLKISARNQILSPIGASLKLQPIVKKQIQINTNKTDSIDNFSSQFEIAKQVDEFLSRNEFDLDPEIIADLFKFAKKQKQNSINSQKQIRK